MFDTTQWSVVLDAADTSPETTAAALEKLCGRYWFPVYTFIRRKGHGVHEAEDLTQGFFQFVLARQAFRAADRAKGRFRSFLLAALTNYLHNEHDRRSTHKRGGRHEIVSLDNGLCETMYLKEASVADVGSCFDRSWAITLVRGVLDALRREHECCGKGALFDGLQPFLTDELEPGACKALAQQFDIQPGAVKVALHRARRRFGELLRREVARTVQRPEDIEPELGHLLATIAGSLPRT